MTLGIWDHSPFWCYCFASSFSPPLPTFSLNWLPSIPVVFLTLHWVSVTEMQLTFSSWSLQPWIEMRRKVKNVNILLHFLRESSSQFCLIRFMLNDSVNIFWDISPSSSTIFTACSIVVCLFVCLFVGVGLIWFCLKAIHGIWACVKVI